MRIRLNLTSGLLLLSILALVSSLLLTVAKALGAHVSALLVVSPILAVLLLTLGLAVLLLILFFREKR